MPGVSGPTGRYSSKGSLFHTPGSLRLDISIPLFNHGVERQHAVIGAIERGDNPEKHACLHAKGYLLVLVGQCRPAVSMPPLQELCPVVAALTPAQAHSIICHGSFAGAERTVSVATASVSWQRF